jgi:hypothetical protein
MLAPPLFEGAVQDSEICAPPAVGVASVGDPGTERAALQHVESLGFVAVAVVLS